MYLGSASFFRASANSTHGARVDHVLIQELWTCVKVTFPDLPGSSFRLEQSGGDHLLLIVDETCAFRFPRPGKHGLKLEIAVLRRLIQRTRIPVPNYDVVDPKGGFASYPLIAGVPLTPARFFTLAPDTADEAISDAVSLLSSLHALEPQLFEPAASWPRMWPSIQFAERLQETCVPLLVDRVPTLAAPLHDFLQRYRNDRAPREVILHGDLVGDHLLVDEQTGRLVGIIDFSDVALGDPAHDFLGFWAYGATAASHAVRTYGQADADPTLLARSRNHYIRYRIDRLFETIADGAGVDTIHCDSAALAILLAEPSDFTDQ